MEQSTSGKFLFEDLKGVEEAITDIFNEFERSPDNLIPMLQSAQRKLGYLPDEILLAIARRIKIPAAKVFGVVTFYEQFKLQPMGRHSIKVCRGTACHVRGSDRIIQEIQSRFNVDPGGTTSDREFTLETVACFGSCALAPVMLVDDSVKGRMDSSKAREVLEEISNEKDGY